MGVRRRSVLSTAATSVVVVSGCLSSELPLFQVSLYNATDGPVSVTVDVVHEGTGEAVVSRTVRLSGSGSERGDRKTVADDFEKGERYEATVAWNDYTEGEMFRADERGSRKLTFEVEEDGIQSHL